MVKPYVLSERYTTPVSDDAYRAGVAGAYFHNRAPSRALEWCESCGGRWVMPAALIGDKEIELDNERLRKAAKNSCGDNGSSHSWMRRFRRALSLRELVCRKERARVLRCCSDRSSISSAIARAKDERLLWGSERFYTFYFPGAIFDKALCEVEVDQNGLVVRKGSAMEYD